MGYFAIMVKNTDTISNLVLRRWHDGVKLVRSKECDALNDAESPFALREILNFPCSVYFDNYDHKAEIVNETCAKICGFESTQDAIGRSVFDFSTKKTAMRSVINQKEILTTKKKKIIEDFLIRKDDVPITFVGLSFPWYSEENKIIGIFGCSIVLNHHSVAQSITKLYQLGLLSNEPLMPLTTSHIHHNYFTRREIQCIQHIMAGNSPKAIGKILSLSHRTIEHYIANIKSKIGVSTNAQMMVKFNDYFNNE
jgi:DNA-binding CsgD family transcriptional regulator